jgi:hypothetical protein
MVGDYCLGLDELALVWIIDVSGLIWKSLGTLGFGLIWIICFLFLGGYMNLRLALNFPEGMKISIDKAYCQTLEVKTGDNVLINEYSDSESIGKIKLINFDCITGKVMLNIQWYFKPQDTEDQSIISSCSDMELFLSEYCMDVEIQTVNGKVRVLTIDEILTMQNYDQDIYFTRARWDHMKKKLDPPLNNWKTDCVCNSIINPDIPFKPCKDCDRILHIACLDNLGSHQCPGCGQNL